MAMNDDAPDPAAALRAARLVAVKIALGQATGVAHSAMQNTEAATEKMLDTAVEMVTRYLGAADAAACPESIKQEAIIRVIGHGLQSQTAAVTQDTIGPRSISYPDDRRGLLKRCGAEALLSPYKTRGAGIIE